MRLGKLSVLLLVAFALAACSADEPSTPSAPPANPVPPPPVVTVNFTVTTTPSALDAGATTPVTVTVRASRSDGQAIPNGTQVALTTTIGSFSFIGGPSSISLDLISGQAQTVLFANGTVGVAVVRGQVVISGQTFTANSSVDFRAPATFFISSVSPNFGSPNGGEQVTIFGGGFDGPLRVLLGGLPATVVSSNASQIRVLTPQIQLGAGETRPVDVQVTINLNEAGQRSDVLPLAFTYGAGSGPLQPIVLSVNPTSGTNDGGTTVTINGDGFEAPVQVLFGQGANAGNFTGAEAVVQDVSRTRIVVTSPPARGFGLNNENQNVNILVKNVNSGRATVATSAFRYGVAIQITAMGPGSGSYLGGTRVTIFGQGFDEPVAVSLGGVGQAVVATSGTEVDFLTAGVVVTSCPANGVITATGVSVTNIEGGQTATASGLSFNYVVPLPLIFGISPTSGFSGSPATISGQNFANNVQVVFGDPTTGSSAAITSKSSTSIGVTVPPPPPGFAFDTEPCDGNGDGIANGQRSVSTPITINVRNLDGTGCVATLSNAYRLGPLSTTCTGDTSTPPTQAEADFTFTTNGLQAIFTDASTGSPTSFSWNFGDPASGAANTSSLENPTHTFTAPNTYTVTLTVNSSGGPDSISKFVTVP
jgi:hypothetical protein